MAILTPDPEDFTATLKLVLELSDRPRDVKIVAVQGIQVPDEVARRLDVFQALESDSDEQAPVKRRPGRPRKVRPEEQE